MKRPQPKGKLPPKELPPDVLISDLKSDYAKDPMLPYGELRELFGVDSPPGHLLFYNVKTFGWVLTTLKISGARRNQTADRYYSIIVKDEKLCRVGNGPHVTQIVRVLIKQKNVKRLAKYFELWKKGATDANTVRDRISTRRAQGQIHRQLGHIRWDW
jgi:hypothetical protein